MDLNDKFEAPRRKRSPLVCIAAVLLVAIVIALVLVFTLRKNNEHTNDSGYGGTFEPPIIFAPPFVSSPPVFSPPEAPPPPASTTPVTPPSSPVVSQTIIMACNGSLYRNVCISSLASYPGASRANLSELAGISVALSLDEAERVTNYIADLKNKSNDSKDSNALQDCVELFQDTVEQLNTSVSKLAHMDSNSFANDIADVQTWVSAALTNPSTCLDGLGEANKNMVPVVNSKTEKSTEFMSNALAVINKLSDVNGMGNYQGNSSRTRRLLFNGDLRQSN